jgi:hypothetical protein
MNSKNHKSTFERYILPTFLSAVAIVAWGCGGKTAPSPISNLGQAFKHLASRAASGSHIYQPTGAINAMGFAAQATAAPSALQQSFQGKCTFVLDLSTIPAGNIIPLVIDRGNDQQCSTFFSAPNPTVGSIVSEDGTVGTLLVVADSTTAQNLVCKDLTNTGPTTDGSFLSVWFQPSTNQVQIFSNTTQLPTTCTVPVSPGDAVTRISAQFLKS